MNGDDGFTPEEADRLLKAMDDAGRADRLGDYFAGSRKARRDIEKAKQDKKK